MRPRIAGNVYHRRGSHLLWVWYWDRRGEKRRQATTSSDEDGARAELQAILDRVRRGEDAAATGDLTLAAFGERWLSSRREAARGDVATEAGHLEHHILPVLGRIRVKDLSASACIDFVRALPSHAAANGSGAKLGATTVHKVAATLRVLLKEAVKRGLIGASPVHWDPGDLPERGSPDVGEGFSDLEVYRLITDERVPEDRRILYALEFLTGMRTGEAAARRWRDWDPAREPLGAMKAETSWSTSRHREKETKTRVKRIIPVHPALAAMLAGWQASGWERFHGRPPGAEDLIIPASLDEHRANHTSWRLFQADLAALQIPPQRHYETRATFISLAEGGGADPASIQLLTHPSPRQAKDLYRRARLLWPQLCRAVLAIHLPTAPAS
jgi:integrase